MKFPEYLILLTTAFGMATSAIASPDSVVVFNEIHYNPPGADESGEWIELFNQMGIITDISGWKLAGSVEFTFPPGTVIDPGDYLVISKTPAAGQVGPFTGKLSNSGEKITLFNQSDRLMDELDYGDSGRWPVAPDGSGLTLAKRKPYTAASPPENWAASAHIGGTPGMPNFPDASQPPPTTVVPLFSPGSNWLYNESDIALPEGWSNTAHAAGNNGWMSGTDPIGFETNIDTPISTSLAFPAFRDPFVVTYYFEKNFTLTAGQASSLQSLQLRHLIDDGAVFYLNGVEVLRLNMPGGAVDAETLAQSVVEVDELSSPISVPAGAAIEGLNRLSVEVHQAGIGDSDIVFGLEMDAIIEGNLPGSAPPVFLSELPAATEAQYWIEMVNEGSAPVDLDGITVSVDGDPSREFVFPPQTLDAGAFLVLTESELGFRPADGEKVFLYDAARSTVLDAQAVTGRLRGRWNDKWLYPTEPSKNAANVFEFNDDIVIGEIAYNPPALPATPDIPGTYETTALFDYNAEWRYNDSDENLPADWATTAHIVGGGWKSAPAIIGFELQSIPEPITTTLTGYDSGTVTYYYEREFDLTAQQVLDLDSIEIMHQIDDGAVFYLNGTEIGRFNMPGGSVGPETFASTGVGNAVIEALTVSNPPVVAGSNRVSVEVHQASDASSDTVFGLKLNARSSITPFVPGLPFRNSTNQWIEIANKGTEPVDIGGWEFADGISFTFPPGTILAGGEHACLAEDAAEFTAAFPGARLLGEYSGSLSRSGERILLRDAWKNPADELTYFDGGRWPDLADGGGSTLELRDLHANNATAESWAASDSTGLTSWKSYSYRGTAEASRGPDSKWSEFNMGMLAAGELLIDDISVIELPDGAALQKLVNTDFSSGADGWRFRGTHRHSEVIDDPDNPGNKVLRLIATGGTGHMHNQIETTLTTPVVNGREYEISFRARWLGGSNQLHTRLYFNRLPGVTVIERPEHVGTPSAPNSRAVSNIGPSITGMIHSPAVPDAGQAVTVSASISDPDNVTGATLLYSVNGGVFQELPMGISSTGNYQATISGQAAASVVQFYIQATDTPGAAAMFPAKGPESRALYKVNDGLAATNGQHNFRIVVTNSERDFIHQPIEVMSNGRIGSTIIDREDDIYYDVQLRLKGSERARNQLNRVGYNMRFGSDKKYRGIHKSLAIDRSEGVGQGQKEILFDMMIANSGGIISRYYDFVKVLAPRNQHTRSAVLQMARYDDVLLDSQFENGSDGSLYEYELLYTPNTADGNGYKIPEPDAASGVPVSNLGDDKEKYRWFFLKKNNRDADDFTPVIAYNKHFAKSGAAFENGLAEIVDIDAWLRGMAYAVLSGAGDNAGAGTQHNGMYYARPDGRIMFLPHDMDFSFDAGRSIFANSECAKLTADPARRRLYFGHLEDIISTTYNSSYMSMWTDHFASLDSSQPWATHLGYVNSRSGNVLNQINSAIPPVGFSISTSNPLTVNSSMASISGEGWVNVRAIRLAGNPEPLNVTWTDSNSWQVTVPVTPGESLVVLEALDFQGNVLASPSITVNNTSQISPAGASNLIISEIHYNPSAPTQAEINAGFTDNNVFEFIELRNVSDNVVNLTNTHFVSGIDFEFSGALEIAPGAHILIVRNLAAFQFRYPSVPLNLIAGEFTNDTGLSAQGERIRLIAADGSTIADFTYSDDHPWPVDADGNGPSMVYIPGSGDPALSASWRNSTMNGGNPGAGDTAPFVGDPMDDQDKDGLAAIVEHFLGTSDLDSSSGPDALQLSASLQFPRNLAADDVEFTVEVSTDLTTWTEGASYASESSQGDGTSIVTYTIPPSAVNTFARLRVQLRP